MLEGEVCGGEIGPGFKTGRSHYLLPPLGHFLCGGLVTEWLLISM